MAVVGGLPVLQLLTLYITPVSYYYFDQIQRRIKGDRSGELRSRAAQLERLKAEES